MERGLIYKAGALSTSRLEAITASLEVAVTQARDKGQETVTVRVFDLDAALDLSRQRGNALDAYRRRA